MSIIFFKGKCVLYFLGNVLIFFFSIYFDDFNVRSKVNNFKFFYNFKRFIIVVIDDIIIIFNKYFMSIGWI